jgi:hypothetical protein
VNRNNFEEWLQHLSDLIYVAAYTRLVIDEMKNSNVILKDEVMLFSKTAADIAKAWRDQFTKETNE